MGKDKKTVLHGFDNLSLNSNDNQIYGQIKEILTTARAKAYSAVNFAMVEAYWLIGKQIVEAQAGNERAEYGTHLFSAMQHSEGKEIRVRGFENESDGYTQNIGRRLYF